MHYSSFVHFKTGLLEAGFPKDKSDATIDILYAYYQHARGQRNLILGRLDDIKPLVAQHGTAFEGGKAALLVTPQGYNDEITKKQGGKWSIWLNDAFILGGIHGHSDFYLKSNNLDALDRVDESSEWVFNVTQRELIGLITFGYGQSGTTSPMGVEYKCTDTRLADSATFKGYCDQMLELKTALKT